MQAIIPYAQLATAIIIYLVTSARAALTGSRTAPLAAVAPITVN